MVGKRGPAKTPTRKLANRGSWRAKERTGEPEVSPELPPSPVWLSKKAAKYWPEIGALLAGLGLLGRPHTIGLALLCEALAEWIRLRDHQQDTVETAKGEFPHPVHGMKWKAWERVLKAAREFGMTPASMASCMTREEPKQGSLGATSLS